MTTGSTDEKPDDRALAPVAGSGLLARYGDLVLLYAAREGDDERTAEVLDAIASAAGGDGRRLGRRLASLLLTAGNQDIEFPPLAAFGPVGDGVAVIVHGAAQVSVVTDDGEIVLDGRDALTWVDRMIPAPARVIRGALDTLGGASHDPWSRLDAGVVRAGGFVFGVPSAIAAAPSPEGAPVAPSVPAEPPVRTAPSVREVQRPVAPVTPIRPVPPVEPAPRMEPVPQVEPAPPAPAPPAPVPPVASAPLIAPAPPAPDDSDDDEGSVQRTEAFNPFSDDPGVQPRPSAPAETEAGPSRGAASVQRGGYEPPAPFTPPAPPVDDDLPPVPPAPPGPPPAPFDDAAPPPPPPSFGDRPPAPPFGDQAPPPPPPSSDQAPPRPFSDQAPPAPSFDDAPPPPRPFSDQAPPAPFGDQAPPAPFGDQAPPPAPFEQPRPPQDGPVHTPTGPAAVIAEPPAPPAPDEAVQPSSAPPDARRGFDPAAPFEAVLLIGDQAEVDDRSQTSGPLPPADVQPPPGPVPADGAEEADARPIVLGIYCKNDHFNDPRVPYCAVCGISMAQLTHVSRTGPRPPLGLLVLDDGATFRLDTDYVVGREPERDDAVLQGRARALRIDDPKGVVSRIHARIELDGWDVNVVDLASANGTHIAPPNSESWTRLEPHRKVTLTPGTRVVFGRRGFRYESHRNP